MKEVIILVTQQYDAATTQHAKFYNISKFICIKLDGSNDLKYF